MTFTGKFVLGFPSQIFSIHRTAKEGGRYLFNSSVPLPPASQTLRHQPGGYCRKRTSADSQQPNANREPYMYLCNTYTHIYCKYICTFIYKYVYVYLYIYIYIYYIYIYILYIYYIYIYIYIYRHHFRYHIKFSKFSQWVVKF